MEKVEIKADKNCKYCRGMGYSMRFFGGYYGVCTCITKQIKIIPTTDEKELMETFKKIEEQMGKKDD